MDNELVNESIKPEQVSADEAYYDVVVEQYKIYVDLAERNTRSRLTTNQYFIALNTFAIGVVVSTLRSPDLLPRWALVVVWLSALLLCTIWWTTLRSFRRLAEAKFTVIDQIEQVLPIRPLVSAEWRGALGQHDGWSRRTQRKTHRHLYVSEGRMVLAFASLQSALLIGLLFRG